MPSVKLPATNASVTASAEPDAPAHRPRHGCPKEETRDCVADDNETVIVAYYDDAAVWSIHGADEWARVTRQMRSGHKSHIDRSVIRADG